MAQYLIAGGSGLIGSRISDLLLEQGHEIVWLSTQKKRQIQRKGIRMVYWQPSENFIDPAFTTPSCNIINLAGAGVSDKRWTVKRKKEILSSRVQALNTLYEAIERGQINTRRLLSASAIGFYADTATAHTEMDVPGNGFLSQTCVAWEAAAARFDTMNIAVCILRIGIVLSTQGGALRELIKPLRLGLAAIPGNGEQMMSWIHIDDISRMMIFLSETSKPGIYNGTADEPVNANRIFDEIQKFKRGFRIHIPNGLMQIVLGEMQAEIMKSAIVSNQKIVSSGFACRFKTIDKAIADLLSS